MSCAAADFITGTQIAAPNVPLKQLQLAQSLMSRTCFFFFFFFWFHLFVLVKFNKPLVIIFHNLTRLFLLSDMYKSLKLFWGDERKTATRTSDHRFLVNTLQASSFWGYFGPVIIASDRFMWGELTLTANWQTNTLIQKNNCVSNFIILPLRKCLLGVLIPTIPKYHIRIKDMIDFFFFISVRISWVFKASPGDGVNEDWEMWLWFP